MSKQKTCLITGATGGIGQTLCAAYRANGWHVIASGRADHPKELDCDVYVKTDLAALATDENAGLEFAKNVRTALSGKTLTSVINNAAIQILGKTEDLNLQDMQLSFNVNAIAPFVIVQTFLPELKAAKGTVVNIGTVHAQSTKSAFVAYATSKTAMHGLTRALAVDLGPDIRVNTLAPAATATPMLMAGFEGKPEAFKSLAEAHPLGRIASPEEIAKASLFLSGPESSFMTGATIYADGGVLSRLHDPG